MKITIETEAGASSAAVTGVPAFENGMNAQGDLDGGSGPGATASGGDLASGDEVDGGAPAQSLLDAIAADPAGYMPSGATADAGSDAGPGPASA